MGPYTASAEDTLSPLGSRYTTRRFVMGRFAHFALIVSEILVRHNALSAIRNARFPFLDLDGHRPLQHLTR
jgi:hypothetical protein